MDVRTCVFFCCCCCCFILFLDALVSSLAPGGYRGIYTQFCAFRCDHLFANDNAITAISPGTPFWEFNNIISSPPAVLILRMSSIQRKNVMNFFYPVPFAGVRMYVLVPHEGQLGYRWAEVCAHLNLASQRQKIFSIRREALSMSQHTAFSRSTQVFSSGDEYDLSPPAVRTLIKKSVQRALRHPRFVWMLRAFGVPYSRSRICQRVSARAWNHPTFFLERSHLSISSAMAEALGLDKKHLELYVSNEFNPSTADGATFALDASLRVH